MLNFFRQIFSKPKPHLSDEARAFVSKLATSDIWILAVGLRGTPSISSITDSESIAIIATHRIDVAQIGDEDSVFPFNYDQDGKSILPFFSSEARARHFFSYISLRIDPAVFQPYCLRAGFVTAPENEKFELMLDPRSPVERRIGRDERLLLRSLSSAA
jgi:hypothetical protein